MVRAWACRAPRWICQRPTIKSTVAQALSVALTAGRSWSVTELLRACEEAHALDQPLDLLGVLAVVPAADAPLGVDDGQALVVRELGAGRGIGRVEPGERQLEASAHQRVDLRLLPRREPPARRVRLERLRVALQHVRLVARGVDRQRDQARVDALELVRDVRHLARDRRAGPGAEREDAREHPWAPEQVLARERTLV